MIYLVSDALFVNQRLQRRGVSNFIFQYLQSPR